VLSLATTATRRAAHDRAISGSGRGLLAADEAELSAFKIEHVLGEQEDPEDDTVRIASYRGGNSGRRRPPRGAVVVVSEKLDGRSVMRAMSGAPGVSSVVEDRWISVAQAKTAAAAPSCVAPSFLAGTVATPVDMDWPGCWVPGITKVAWFGERCNSYMSGTRWVGMYAFFSTNSSLVPGCVRYRARKDPNPFNAENFGDCSVPPAVADQLPTRLCSESSAKRAQQPQPQPPQACIPADQTDEWRSKLEEPVRCSGVSTAEAVYRGVRCGPGLRWVRWSSITLPEGGKSCRFSRNSNDPRWNAQWLGQCGVPPQYNTGMPMRVCSVVNESGQQQRNETYHGDSAAQTAPLPAPVQTGPSPIPAPIPAPIEAAPLSPEAPLASNPQPSSPPPPPPSSPPPPVSSPPPPPLPLPQSQPASGARFKLAKGESLFRSRFGVCRLLPS